MLNIENISYWERKSFFEKLDFLILGAGIVGYSSALHLRKKFPTAKILVIERGILPSGASSKNAGFACFGSATELYDDLSRMEEDEVWKTVELRWKGLQSLRKIIGDSSLDLKINGSWDLITDKENELFAATQEKLELFNSKLAAITGEKNVYSIDSSVAQNFGFNHIKTSIYNRLEGQIDTSKMNTAFHSLVVNANIQVLFGIEAKEIETTAAGTIASTSFGEISAKKMIICTNGFAAQFIPNEKILPARAQVLITEPIEGLAIKGTFHYNQGYYYFRNIDNRILLGGGRNLDFEGETTTQLDTTPQIQAKLLELLHEVILPGKKVTVDHSWSGIMGVGPTKKPIIKQVSEHAYCGVRLGGMGVAIGTLVGKEVVDLIKF